MKRANRTALTLGFLVITAVLLINSPWTVFKRVAREREDIRFAFR